jgi:hypothetical protein
MTMTREEGVARMKALAGRQPLPTLATSLEMLAAKPQLDDAERLTHAVIMDVICERCPAAEAVFAAWCDSDDYDLDAPVAAVVAAARR